MFPYLSTRSPSNRCTLYFGNDSIYQYYTSIIFMPKSHASPSLYDLEHAGIDINHDSIMIDCQFKMDTHHDSWNQWWMKVEIVCPSVLFIEKSNHQSINWLIETNRWCIEFILYRTFFLSWAQIRWFVSEFPLKTALDYGVVKTYARFSQIPDVLLSCVK